MKTWFYSYGKYEQTIQSDLDWNCTCMHGSIGRYQKDMDFPCIHTILALKEWAGEILKRRKK